MADISQKPKKVGYNQAIKSVVRDPKTGRFVSKSSLNPETIVPPVEPIPAEVLAVSELVKFTNKSIGKVKKNHKLSQKTKKSVEKVISNIVNIAAASGGAEMFLGAAKDQLESKHQISDAFENDPEININPSKSESKLTKSPIVTPVNKILKDSELIKEKEVTTAGILEKIEENTAQTATALEITKKEEKKKTAEKKRKEREEKASNPKKKRKSKDELGFFEGIGENIKHSPGGKFVRSVGSLFKSKKTIAGSAVAEGVEEAGAGAVVGRAALAAAPYVAIAGIVALAAKGLYDHFNKQTGPQPGDTGQPEGEAPEDKLDLLPESDALKKRISAFEGPNKSKGDFSKLNHEQQLEALRIGEPGNPAILESDIKVFQQNQEMREQRDKDKEQEAAFYKSQGSTTLNHLSARGSQFDMGRRGYDSSERFIPGQSPRLNSPYAVSGGLNMFQNIEDPNISTQGKALLDTIASKESGGDYNIREGGGHVSDLSQFPEGYGPGGISSASGKYQFIRGTWEEAARALGLKDFSPESQDKAAWWLAQRDYYKATGGNLAVDVKSKDPNKQLQIANALHNTWTSMPGGFDQGLGKPGRNSQEYLATLNHNDQKYSELANKSDTGSKLANATVENDKMVTKLADNPPPVVVNPSQTPSIQNHNQMIGDVMPNSRNDDPILLRALQADIKQA